MAVVAPVTAVSAVLIPVLAEALAGVRIPFVTMAGIAVALVAIVLVSQQDPGPSTEVLPPADPPSARSVSGDAATSNPRVARGIGLALLSGVAIGLFFLALARTSAAAGLWPLVAARVVSVSLFAALGLAAGRSLRLRGRVAGIALAGGVLDMTANALYLFATRFGPLSVAVTLCSLYPASTVILARVVLDERLNRRQGLGIVCAFVAIALIVSG